MANLLELNHVSKVYSRGLINAQATTALHDISLTLREDEPTTVVLTRLIARVTRSQELRRIVVAHILQGAVA